MWDTNPVDAYLAEFIGVLDAALGYLEPPIFGLYDTLMILGIAALSVFLLRGGREGVGAQIGRDPGRLG